MNDLLSLMAQQHFVDPLSVQPGPTSISIGRHCSLNSPWASKHFFTAGTARKSEKKRYFKRLLSHIFK